MVAPPGFQRFRRPVLEDHELQPYDLANGILHSYTTQKEVIDELIIRQLV